MKKVSIVVPIYNAEKYIRYCIESLLVQTYKNIEIILVDDGSTDKTECICRDCKDKNSNIIYIKQNNKGVSEARNTGVKVATGEYIFFVDSDDIIDVNMIEKLVVATERWGTELAISAYKEFDDYMLAKEHSKNIKRKVNNLIFDEKEYNNQFAELFFRYPNISLFSIWGKLYHANIIKQNNILFPAEISYGEDMWFNLLYYRYCHGVIMLPECLYYYMKVNSQSLDSKFKKNLYDNVKNLNLDIKNYLVEKNVYCGINKVSLERHYRERIWFCLHNLALHDTMISEQECINELTRILQDEDVQVSFSNRKEAVGEYENLVETLIIEKNVLKLYEVIKNEKQIRQDQTKFMYRLQRHINERGFIATLVKGMQKII